MAKKKAPKSKKLQPTTAFHAQHENGLHHIVGIGNLRVVLVPDGDVWFAQGLEIDYAAQGANKEDAKTQFENGLLSTIQEHLHVYGNIKGMLRVAPQAVWHELLYERNAELKLYTQVSGHEIENFPFAAIDYIAASTAA
jgi:hypothetical protein